MSTSNLLAYNCKIQNKCPLGNKCNLDDIVNQVYISAKKNSINKAYISLTSRYYNQLTGSMV